MNGLKIARDYKETLLCKYDEARQNAKAQVIKLFYGALLAQTRVGILEEALGLSFETHRLAVARFTLGKSSQIDTLSSRLGIEKARMDIQSARGDLKSVYEALIRQAELHIPADSFSVKGEFPRDEYGISLDEAVAAFRRDNKKLGQLRGGYLVQERLIKMARTDYLPLVYCGGSLGKYLLFDRAGDIDWGKEGQDDRSVFIGATYTLFNGLQRRQKVKQAVEDMNTFRLTMEQATDGLEIALRAAWEAMETHRQQLASARALTDLAARAVELARKAYELGSITLFELQQRELADREAQLALNAARYGFHNAVLDLKLLMGALSMNE
jgi:outer membrane protein